MSESHADHFRSIQAVLAAYRSTVGHVTKEQITDAWAELAAARERARLDLSEREYVIDVLAQIADCNLSAEEAEKRAWAALIVLGAR